MAVDNRTMLNDCSTTTGWTGDDSVTARTGTDFVGLIYEGSTSLSTQLSNADEYMATTQQSDGGDLGTFSLNLANSTVYMIIKDNLIDTQTNGGVKFVLGDGTNLGGWEIGGHDNTGIPLPAFFNGYRLDVSNRGSFTPHTFAGTPASLNDAAVTEIGYGSLHLSKAQGAIDNVYMDAFRYIDNTLYALTVNAGTIGTPITLSTLASDDETNGWGLISNPIGQQYIIAGTIEFGANGTADSFFQQTDSQIFLDGTGIGVGNYNFRVFGNATGNNSFVLDNCILVGTGEPGNWDMSDADNNTITLTDTTFVDNGTFTFPLNNVNKQMNGGGFTGCDQINFSTMTANNITITGSTSQTDNGAILLNSAGSSNNQTNVTFNTTEQGHAVYITATGTYTFTGWNFNGYSTDSPGTNEAPNSGSANAMVYNNSGGLVTLNVSDGDTPTIRNGAGANTQVVASITITLTGMKDSTEVRVYDSEDSIPPYATPTELAGIENATAGSTDDRSFAFSATPGNVIYIKTFNLNWISDVITLTVPGTSTSIPIAQRLDRVYDNPS